MMKNKNFFLLVLFSLFALNSHKTEHKKYERKRSLTEKFIKTAMVGLILSHACPILINAHMRLPHPSQYMRLIDMIKSSNFQALKELYSRNEFMGNSKLAPAYILAVASAQALTALISKHIF